MFLETGRQAGGGKYAFLCILTCKCALFCLYMFTSLCFMHIEAHACVRVCVCACVQRDCVLPSFEERQCSTFHRGTESLPKQELKPGGHGSACSVNRSS